MPSKFSYYRPALCGIIALGLSSGQQPASTELYVGLNKSNVLENSAGVKRISVATPEVAEAVAVSKTEVLINGKSPGDTSLILWDQDGHRTIFNVHVTAPDNRPDVVRGELEHELSGQKVNLDFQGGTVFLRGVVNDVTSADRATAIASTLGKVVNLLNVKVPEADPQILLKVRFANVERAAAQSLAFNLISTGATNTIGTVSTRQFGQQPTLDFTRNPFTVEFNDLLNIFFFRRDLNLAGTLEALEQKQLVQILAEPNLLTVSGRPASFLAGGEFPYPTLQGGAAGVGQITIQFREFGIRIHFQPTITPRGSIRLMVTPEVSALDFANGLTVSGYTVPGLSTRRVQTEVELENGQSFVIAGLLDNRTTQQLSKIPGLSSIPVLGKLFESRSLQKNNSQLLVLVTPELVRPLPADAKPPQLAMPKTFLPGQPSTPPQMPTNKDAKLPVQTTIPLETLKGWKEPEAVTPPASTSSTDALPALKPMSQTNPAGSDQGTGANPNH